MKNVQRFSNKNINYNVALVPWLVQIIKFGAAIYYFIFETDKRSFDCIKENLGERNTGDKYMQFGPCARLSKE